MIAAELDAQIAAVEAIADASAREIALAGIQGLLELYGEGLARMSARLDQDTVLALAEDEVIRHLLLLHGLHPVDLTTRVREALDSVRPYLESHGGNVDLLGIDDGVAKLRLQGTCNGCASSETTLKGLIEKALHDAAPDLEGIDTEQNSNAGSFVALECLVPARP